MKDKSNRLSKMTTIIVISLLVLTAIVWSVIKMSGTAFATNPKITALYTDQAMYDPGSEITIIGEIEVPSDGKEVSGSYSLVAKHLEKQVGEEISDTYKTDQDGKARLEIKWESPEVDFKGYLLDLTLTDQEGNVLESETVGVDVSSEWTKFPRYGYVWDFTDDVNVASKIEQMNHYHINAIEYYDWQYRHHMPVPDDGSMEWDDWTGRKINGNIIKDYIKEAKNHNMSNMAYNMIYAGTNSYQEDGVSDEWGLWYAEDHGEVGKRKGDRFTFEMGSSPTGQSHLFFFDLLNEDWQAYIFEKQKVAMDQLGFDGWHGDTVGEWGKMWTHENIGDDSKTQYVMDGYTEFLNAAKESIGAKYLVFNPVGAQGIEKVNVSDVDALYTEFWPWDHDINGEQYDTYNALKTEIIRSRDESNGKSLITKAYMQYDYAEHNAAVPFNMSAVLLTDAAAFAAGGSRMEMGDGNNMLSNEYFPSQNLYMTPEHEERQKDLYDFIVAYENILRDGQDEIDRVIEFEDYQTSTDGEPNTIWSYAKEDDQYEIIQMINLMDVQTNDWRANEGEKDTPRLMKDIKVKYYTDKDVKSAWVTSPDPAFNGRSKKVSFETEEDEHGTFITFEIPSLEYWDVVYLSEEEGDEHPDNEKIGSLNVYESEGDLTNGEFAEGLEGWNVYGENVSVEDNKVEFQGKKYAQSISQTVVGLENGEYEVVFTGNQHGAKAHRSRIELAGFGGDHFFEDLPLGVDPETMTTKVNVENNRLNITIHHESINGANLTIDSIELKKVD